MDFFDLTKQFTRKQLKGGQTDGFIKLNNDNVNYVKKEKILSEEKEEEEEEKGSVEKYFFEPKKLISLYKMMKESEETEQDLKENHCTELMSVGTLPDISEIDNEKATKLYAQYIKQENSSGTKLIINSFKSKILSMIELNEVTIISGPTGCGKTTQVPQYILDSHAKKNKFCNIIVAQPRRIAAISLARRICEERNWPMGSICGYKVGLVNCMSQDTRLLYVTAGVLLQILLNKKNLNDYTHVILDEIHEQDHSTDFALLIVKKYLNSNSRNVKVILMSATANAYKFANYFERPLCGELQPAPIITITQPHKYLVQIHYLEELTELGELPEVDINNPHISTLHIMTGINLIKQFEKFDKLEANKKSVLVFLPGIYEIKEFYEKLKDPNIYKSGKTEYHWFPVPLHSSITIEEQAQAFRPAPIGYRKIILATNIAESSITVPDVMFVIDYCLTKLLVTDRESNFTCLQLRWASKSNLIQRGGRTGRVSNGRVYRMISKDIYDNLDEHSIPEMLRCPLERVVLQAKLLDVGPPKAVLALAIDPPDLENIVKTILILKEVGGLLTTCNGVRSSVDGDLTFLGYLMAVMPVDVYITKLIALGYSYNCLEKSIIMGAAMSLKCLFSNSFQAKLKSYNSKLYWADGSWSDCIAFLNVYEVWRMNHARGYYKRSYCGGESAWARRHFIQLRTLKEIQILVEDIKCRLERHGIEAPMGSNGGSNTWNETEENLVLKFIIAGAFYPNYFTRGALGGQVNEREAVRILRGRDPLSTVYLENYPMSQPPHLYSNQIEEKLKDFLAEDMEITYDHGKVFIEFAKNELPDKEPEPIFNGCNETPRKISLAVYRAVKLRDAIRNFEINMFPFEKAQEKSNLMKRKKEERLENWDDPSLESPEKEEMFDSVLPCVEDDFISIKITHIVNPSDFWATLKNLDTVKQEKNLFKWLNDSYADMEVFSGLPEVGEICAAPSRFENEIWFRRGRIEGFKENSNGIVAEVFFIDFGHTEMIPANDLRKFGSNLLKSVGEIPGLAFRCTLWNIEPSSSGIWSDSAKKRFVRLVENGDLIGSIQSISDRVVSVILYKITGKNVAKKQINLNAVLLEERFAQLSKKCEKRENSGSNQKAAGKAENIWPNPPPMDFSDSEMGKIPVKLRGPFSPLEMNIFSCTRGGSSKLVKVSTNSVNCILMDTDPRDPHERLVVAGRVGQNPSGSILILQDTTIMPNIHGLAALVPLVFAPTIELRVNDKKSCYTGFVCGLGADESGRSLFPERDMEIIFDCEFTPEDLATVNKVRFFTSNLLMGRGFPDPIRGFPDVVSFQSKIREGFVDLIGKKRKSKEIEFPENRFEWKQVESDSVVAAKGNFFPSNDQISIFPPHSGVRIKSQSEEDGKLAENLKFIRDVAQSRNENAGTNIVCEICDLTLLNLNFLRLHLASESHKTKEEKFLGNFHTGIDCESEMCYSGA